MSRVGRALRRFLVQVYPRAAGRWALCVACSFASRSREGTMTSMERSGRRDHNLRQESRAGAGRVIQVRSWYQGPDSIDEEKFEKRLAALRARLKVIPKLRVIPTLTTKHLRDITIPAPFPGAAPWIVGEMRVDASTTSLGGSRNIVLARGPLEVVERRELPGAALVIIRYRGIFFETGYTTETALLLTAKP